MMPSHQKLPDVDLELAGNIRVAIVRTDYHAELIDRLEHACRSTLAAYGVTGERVDTFAAPGSWEIPLLVKKALETERYDAVIAFGVIVKGETYHFDMIANECARALMQLALDHEVPVINEVLAVFDIDHAAARAGNDDRNKGIEAALAALKIVPALRKLQ